MQLLVNSDGLHVASRAMAIKAQCRVRGRLQGCKGASQLRVDRIALWCTARVRCRALDHCKVSKCAFGISP